jgi:hypothetical protein
MAADRPDQPRTVPGAESVAIDFYERDAGTSETLLVRHVDHRLAAGERGPIDLRAGALVDL